MKKFTQRNAVTATLLNLIINIVAPFIIFYRYESINLKGDNPNVMDLLLPAVVISVFATTMATFVTMTKQRVAQKLHPVLATDTAWLPTAFVTSLVLALLFAGVAFLLIVLIQSVAGNGQLPKPAALALSGVVGAFVALLTSFIAVRRASLIH